MPRGAAGAARRRRNRRASVPGAGAGRGAAKARRRHRSRHRHARRAFQVSRPRRARDPERDLARAQSVGAGAHRRAAHARHGKSLGDARPRQARGGGRLWRLSDRAAAFCRQPARHPNRAARAERRHGPRQPAAGLARHRHRHRLSHPQESRCALAGQTHFHRQSGAPRSDRRGGDALCRARAEENCALWCSAAARARG